MTTQVVSNYAKRMARLSAKIFGEVSRPTPTKSLKVVKLFAEEPVYQKPSVVEYYPRHPEIGQLIRHVRFLGLYRDEHEDFADEMTRLRELRGKIKPKKGEGKRSAKRKLTET